MTDTSTIQPSGSLSDPVRALIKAIVLCVLCMWAFQSEFKRLFEQACTMAEAGHTLALPVLVALLVYRRRDALREDLRPGSVWGVVIVACGILLYAATTWPFTFGYPRKLQFVVVAAGGALAIGGWRVLWRCLPIVLLILIAMPIGSSSFAALTIRPETITLDITAAILHQLPSVSVELRGSDLHYLHAGAHGIIALGDPHRGFVVPLAHLSIIVFVAFSSMRPTWQLIVLGALAVPLALISNLCRILLHSVLTIYRSAAPLDSLPRDVAIAFSLVLTYVVILTCAKVLSHLLVDARATEEDAALATDPEDQAYGHAE